MTSYCVSSLTYKGHRVIAAGCSQAELLHMGVGLQGLCKFLQGWNWNVLEHRRQGWLYTTHSTLTLNLKILFFIFDWTQGLTCDKPPSPPR